MSWAEEEIERISHWIGEQVGASGATGAVVGLSGGVDSSVVAALCQRALGDRVFGVIMPCHSNPEDQEDAKLLAAHLQLAYRVVPLEPAYDALLAALTAAADGPVQPLARANIKPRLRMTTLYFMAAQRNSIVVGTGNRSELYIGYFTKYGDGGVDLLPLGHLVKSQVWELARALNLPERVIRKAPSAGLWEGQTDEGEMGFTYAELDRYLVEGTASPEVKARIDALHAASAHKRGLAPSLD